MSTVVAVFAEVCCPLSFLARQRLLSSVGWGVSFLVVFLKALLEMTALVALRILNDEQKNERATLSKFPLPKCTFLFRVFFQRGSAGELSESSTLVARDTSRQYPLYRSS